VGMVFPGCSVHGLGMDRDLWVVALDAVGTVLAVRGLAPGGVVWVRGARRLVEIERWRPVPPVGAGVVQSAALPWRW